MMIKNLTSDYLKECLNIWNEDVGFIFPFSFEMFKEKSIDCRYFCSDASFVAIEKDEVIGFIIAKLFDNNPNIPKYQNYGWISLIFVKRKYRKQGYGKALLDSSEEVLKKKGVKSISVGSLGHLVRDEQPDDVVLCR